MTAGYLRRTAWQSLPLLRYRMAGGEENRVKERVSKITSVQHDLTLVIHGELAPMLPIEHGRRLAQLIPSAKALFLPNVGHVLLYPPMPPVMEAIALHLRTAASQ